jgi:uncharacterized RDD family membrane protein YckC
MNRYCPRCATETTPTELGRCPRCREMLPATAGVVVSENPYATPRLEEMPVKSKRRRQRHWSLSLDAAILSLCCALAFLLIYTRGAPPVAVLLMVVGFVSAGSALVGGTFRRSAITVGMATISLAIHGAFLLLLILSRGYVR